MPNDLQLSDQDEVLLESLVLAASDNVTRAPGSDRSQFAPTRRRVFVETDGNENVYLGTGNAWVDVSENTGLLSSLFGGGDGNFDSVDTGSATVTNQVDAGSVNTGEVSNGGDFVNLPDGYELDNLPEDETIKVSRGKFDTGSPDEVAGYIQRTNSVSTSGKTILSAGEYGGLVIVGGNEIGSGVQFTDLVLVSAGDDYNVVSQVSTGVAASRTYGFNGMDLTLTLSDNTYDIIARGDWIEIIGF